MLLVLFITLLIDVKESPIFSKTAQYAFRIVIFMSSDTDRLFSAAFIHEKIDIPYKYLTMLIGGHGTWVNIEVWVQLENGDG